MASVSAATRFVMKYGALASFEDPNKAENLSEETQNILNLMSDNHPPERPSVPVRQLERWVWKEIVYEKCTFWEAYGLYRGVLLFYALVNSRQKELNRVLDELNSRNMQGNLAEDPNRPVLQTLKESCHRIRTIGKVLDALYRAKQASRLSIDKFKEGIPEHIKTAFDVSAKASSSLYSLWFTEERMAESLITYELFNQQHAVKIGKVPQEFTGQELNIIANFDPDFSGMINIQLIPEGTETPIALLKIAVEKQMSETRYFSSFDESPEEEEKWPVRRFTVVDTLRDRSEQNPQTGDRPRARILVQLIVEIFFRSHLKTLKLVACEGMCFVMKAAGFNLPPRSQDILEPDLVEAKQRALVFPLSNDLPSHTFSLIKPNEGAFDPQVRFQANQSSESWKKVIERQGFLFGAGPILPY